MAFTVPKGMGRLFCDLPSSQCIGVIKFINVLVLIYCKTVYCGGKSDLILDFSKVA